MTLVFQAIGILLFVALMFIAFVVFVFIAADRFWQGVDRRKAEALAARPEVSFAVKSVSPPPAWPPVWPAVWQLEEDVPVYLRKWTAGRKLDATREQEQWQKLFDSSQR